MYEYFYTQIRLPHSRIQRNTYIYTGVGPAAKNFLTDLIKFVNQCLAGKLPPPITPLFIGAFLCPLKKDVGVRPIAVGNALCRMVVRAAVIRSMSTPVMMAWLLSH